MKKFSSEIGHNYDSYTFGYASYCLYERGDSLSEIYKQGYLPYSGSPDLKNIFYMARSSRIPLDSFYLSSENRRIMKKFEKGFQSKSTPLSEFDTHNQEFLLFCLNYFKKRHGPKVMPLARLKFILNNGLVTNIIEGRIDGEVISYIFEVTEKDMTHFWYSFYDLSLINQSLGLWLMIDSAVRAKERGEKYLYIGTLYGEKALYKKAFDNLEYWNGAEWSSGINKIKQLVKEDHAKLLKLSDRLKRDVELF